MKRLPMQPHFLVAVLAVCLALGWLAVGAMKPQTAVVLASSVTQAQEQRPKPSTAERLSLWWDFFFNKPADTAPTSPIPVQPITRAELLAAPDGSLYRLGHSTLLMKLRGKFWLTDPVFSERASPSQWFGPTRFHAPPISIDQLPPIEAVILSHDHYDHLDQDSIQQLDALTAHFVAPRGVGNILIDWGIAANKVQQLDWWQSTAVSGVHLVATPAQHFSGRGLMDANRTLWSSWVILDGKHRIFFGGDSGYFNGFKAIGDRYGPFDITLLEAGAYDERWIEIHMRPEQTVQAHQDLRGRWLFPIHNGTFDLAFHPWQQPYERVLRQSAISGVSVSTSQMGQRVDVLSVDPGSLWWRKNETWRTL